MRVVMLGGNYEHLEIDSAFLQWVKNDRKLNDDEVVLEWIDENPFFQGLRGSVWVDSDERAV